MTELFVIAAIAGRTVAIAAAQVNSVIDIGSIVRVPLAPPVVRGITALRSRVATVIDPVAALGLGASPAGRRVIVSLIDSHLYAFMVDAAADVSPFVRQPLMPGLAPRGGWEAVADGMIERDGEAVLIVDLVRLVPTFSAAA